MRNIWLKRREVNDFKKKKEYIHSILSPITNISNPISNCIIWGTNFSDGVFFKKYKFQFIYLFIKYLTDSASSIVNFDYSYDNKALVDDNGVEELWAVDYKIHDLCDGWMDGEAAKHMFSLSDPQLDLCQRLAKESAEQIEKTILSDIELFKNNDIFEYNYYINSLILNKNSNGLEKIKIKFAKVLVLK